MSRNLEAINEEVRRACDDSPGIEVFAAGLCPLPEGRA